MTRARLGTTLICIAAALAFGTYLAWSFSTRSEEKAQYSANLVAAATGEEPRDIEPNRLPAYIVAASAATVLLIGLVLRKPRPAPRTPMSTAFWGRPADGDPSDP